MSENNNEDEAAEAKTTEIMYAIAETIENGEVMVSASPELWIKGHILYWPPGPGPANRQNPSPPEADWIPHMCRILKGSIATFEEALELEQRYSVHNDSKSFRKAQALKQLRRDHPVNENPQSDLIDANSMVNEIDSHVEQVNESEAVDDVRNKYHKNCLESNDANLKSKTLKKKKNNIVKAGLKQAQNQFKLKNSNLKQGDVVKDLKKQTLPPRYINYLKSGNKFSSNKTGVLQQKNILPPKKTASATITKAQFLKQNEIHETENQDPIGPPTLDVPFEVGELSKNRTSFAALQRSIGFDNNVKNTTNEIDLSRNEDVGMAQFDEFAKMHMLAGNHVQIDASKRNEGVIKKRKIEVTENVSIGPTSSSTPISGMRFEERVLRELNELKKDQQKAEEKRVVFEARMEVKWDVFVKGTSQNQGQNQNKCEDPDLVDESDDFEDLDQNFPITVFQNVEEFNWSIQNDLPFKRRMRRRLNDECGNDPTASIRKKMKYLISDTVLERYSWRGTLHTNKKPFKNLVALNNLVYESVKEQFSSYKKIDYRNYMINNWLKHSRTRQRVVTYRYPNRNHQNDDFDDEVEEENEEEEDNN